MLNKNKILSLSIIAFFAFAQELIFAKSGCSSEIVLSETQSKDFINNLLSDGIKILNNEDSVSKQNKDFAELLEKNFATTEIAKLVLGKIYRDLNENQKKIFIDLYKRNILQVYADPEKTSKFRNISFTIDEVIQEGKTVLVKTIFKNDSQNIPVNWKIFQSNGKIYVLDVIIEGVSQIITARSEYSAIYQSVNNNPEKFIEKVKEKTN
jgi:phospholipid transport system substrate-binding protein